MSTTNPVVYFEIPVTDLDRAEAFYKQVLGFVFEREVIDGYDMALFPFTDHIAGISGALAKGEAYVPSKNGAVLYFKTKDIDDTIRKAEEQGANVLYPKTTNDKYGFFVAEIEDSEGNRIALHQEF